jgi:hypothetical protein
VQGEQGEQGVGGATAFSDLPGLATGDERTANEPGGIRR